jgi:hypothetical protein
MSTKCLLSDYVRPTYPKKIKLYDLIDILTGIEKEYYNRKKSRFIKDHPGLGLSKAETARYFFLREIYDLGIHLQENPPSFSRQELLSKARKHKLRAQEIVDCTFHMLTMSCFQEDADRPGKSSAVRLAGDYQTPSRQERNTMVRELQYARRHEVPPQFLCGFLLQSKGRTNLRNKLKDGYVEPMFRTDDYDGPI